MYIYIYIAHAWFMTMTFYFMVTDMKTDSV